MRNSKQVRIYPDDEIIIKRSYPLERGMKDKIHKLIEELIYVKKKR